MTDPRHTNPPPDPRVPGASGPMWAWIAGIAVAVLIAFALAAGWSNNPQTAGNEPPATVGSGGTTMPPATGERGTAGSTTTGSGTTGGAPTATPNRPKSPAPGTQSGGQ